MEERRGENHMVAPYLVTAHTEETEETTSCTAALAASLLISDRHATGLSDESQWRDVRTSEASFSSPLGGAAPIVSI